MSNISCSRGEFLYILTKGKKYWKPWNFNAVRVFICTFFIDPACISWKQSTLPTPMSSVLKNIAEQSAGNTVYLGSVLDLLPLNYQRGFVNLHFLWLKLLRHYSEWPWYFFYYKLCPNFLICISFFPVSRLNNFCDTDLFQAGSVEERVIPGLSWPLTA